MKKKLYRIARIKQCWYNSVQTVAYTLLKKPVPDNLIYEDKIRYGTERYEYYNAFRRRDLENVKKPIFIYIHGGGWIAGVMKLRDSYVEEFAELGFFASSLNYMLAPQAVYPTQIKECFAGIDNLLDNAEKFNIDPSNVVLASESAGGYFISFIAECCNDPTILDKLGITFRHLDSFHINALIMHCPGINLNRLTDKTKKQSSFVDMQLMIEAYTGMEKSELMNWLETEEGKLASPQIRKGFPPTMLIWAPMDKLRFEAFDIKKDLEKINTPYQEYRCYGMCMPHAWSIITLFDSGKDCLEKTLDFVLPYFTKYFDKKENKWIFKSPLA